MKYNGQSYTTALFKLLACSILMLCTSLMSFAQPAPSYTTWTGNTDAADWDKEANWSNGKPNKDKDVIIPADCTTYPVCNENSECNYIYIASGARLGNQHLLTYKQAFVDVTIPTNRYVRLIPPLRETYSGDFFTKEQGGVWDGYFTAASYEPTDEKNRVFPGATYQSLFSEAATEVDAYQNYTVASVQTGWTSPKNALNTKYKALQGIDVWVDDGHTGENDNNKTATFRFPSEEEEYAYFDLNGKQQTFGEKVPRSKDESGKFVYDENTCDDYGNYNLNYWREAGSDNPMFCVGNPAMAYLDVKKFLDGNSNNITPFIYLHNEVYGGRGTETILYYNNAEETLHQVQADYTGNKDENIPPTDPSTPLDNYYIRPTQGFRVMPGGTTLHAVEPGLIGAVSGTYRQREYYTKKDEKEETTAANNNTFNMSISIDPTDPYKAELSNLIGVGNVYATINKEEGTLTIKNGSPIRFVDNTWENGDKTLYIYGCKSNDVEFSDDYIEYKEESLLGSGWFSTKYYTKYITNIGDDVVFSYGYDNNGNIIIKQKNPFVIYSQQTSYEAKTIPYKDSECVAWYVYDNISATKSSNLGQNFILPEAEGVYESIVQSITNTGSVIDDVSIGGYGNIILQHINGTSDLVIISGLYPGVTSNVIGTIVQEGTSYKLTIPAGQIVKQTDQNDPSKNWHLYYENGRKDLVLTWDNGTWRGTKELNGRAQISRQNSTPSGTSPGFYLGDKFKVTVSGKDWLGRPTNKEETHYQFSLTNRKELPNNSSGNTSIENEITASQNLNLLTLIFTPEMFEPNPVINPSAAPQRRKVQAKEASPLITITAQGAEYSGSTLLVKNEKARAAYSAMEDAPLADINKQSFCIASLAGEQVVGVNVFDNMDIIPLFLQGDAQALSLQFNNIEALNYEAELYDAVEENSTPITPGNCSIDIQLYGDQAAGRFFIRKKESVTPPNDATDLSSANTDWTAHAWCPAPGTLVITSGLINKVGNIRLFNLAGQELINTTCKDIHTIKSLSSGIYIVKVSKNNEVKTLKVQVK